MKTPKVRLYIRIKVAQKDRFADPAYAKNHSLREGYALVLGKPEHHPEGVFYLRYCHLGGKRRWEAIGVSAEVAIVDLRNREHDLQAEVLGRVAHPRDQPVLPPAAPIQSTLLRDAVTAYLHRVESLRSRRTFAAYTNILSALSSSFGELPIEELRREHLLDHLLVLRARGCKERTIHNHMAQIAAFLKRLGVSSPLSRRDLPKYDQKLVTAYNADELSSLLEKSGATERLL